MVNKIDGNNYYAYTKPTKLNIPDSGEKFSLDSEKDGLPAGSKDKKETSDPGKEQAAERDGVRVEFSGTGIEKQKQVRAMDPAKASGTSSLLETIRTFLTTAFKAVKEIFSSIWNSQPPEESLKDPTEIPEAADTPETIDTTGSAVDTDAPEAAGVIRVTGIIESTGFTDTAETISHTDEENEREIRKHLQNGDMDQVIRLLTDNGRKTPARNSTLLTSYDRNGRMVKLDASVRQRTLYGDRNTRKL